MLNMALQKQYTPQIILNKTGTCSGGKFAHPIASSILVPYFPPTNAVQGLVWVANDHSWQVLQAGIYAVYGAFYYASGQNFGTNATGNVSGSVARAMIYKNGNLLVNEPDNHISANIALDSTVICVVTAPAIQMAANDTVSIRSYHDSQGAKTIGSGGDQFHFQICKIL